MKTSAERRSFFWGRSAQTTTAICGQRRRRVIVKAFVTDDGRPIQAEFRLRAGKRSITVHLQIFDDTCSPGRVTSSWWSLSLSLARGERVFADSGWRHVGNGGVAEPGPDVVNGRTAEEGEAGSRATVEAPPGPQRRSTAIRPRHGSSRDGPFR